MGKRGPKPQPPEKLKSQRFSLRFLASDKAILDQSGITADQWRKWMLAKASRSAKR